ncbi:unnamed protein product [Tetraodon nigroviridis]|uniref:(spotted green pufferfish) hypothetical protein n=1 Tax=Tetraodon nigroviridis TaxID=99883 RepID=Q4RYR1_TETNG|nr:unnamed protein product [Tetraodon nigroviridis]
MICILLVAGHGTLLETQIKNDDTGLYSHLAGVPKALLPGNGGKKILDFWWETVNMRQLFTEVYLVTNADKYKHYERWATANDFPVENVVNDGSTTLEDRLGAVADLELVVRSRKLRGDMLCADQNFDVAQVIRFFRSKVSEWLVNEKQLDVFGMKLPTGFQLIGQVLLPHPLNDPTEFGSLQDLFCISRKEGYLGGLRLLQATCKKFYQFCSRQGAIVSATLKCLMKFYNITDNDLPRPIRANFILNVETDELFITAGLQDRVVQVYEGLVYMDFSKELMDERGYGNYVSLDMSVLPPFWLAYLSDPSDSGRIHSNIRQRWLGGEPLVVEAMRTFAELTDAARAALENRDWTRLAQLMDQNFELRRHAACDVSIRTVYTDECLGPGNLKMVQLAKQFGSAVKLPGSGGAVVGLCLDAAKLVEMRQAFQEAGCVFCVLTPYDPSANAASG